SEHGRQGAASWFGRSIHLIPPWSWTPVHSHDLELGNEVTALEPVQSERVERGVAAKAEHAVAHDPAHGRGDHESVPAEAGGEPETVVTRHGADYRLMIGRDVVEPLDHDRIADVLEDRQELGGDLDDVRTPTRRVLVRVAVGREVGGEHAAVAEVLG